jgi:acylphosphatase
MQRRIYHFSGRVQGVGFRFTAHAIARNFEVTGYVQNLSDGRVRLVVEGEADEIDRFFEAVKEQMGGYVRGVTRETATATGEFSNFAVKH